MSLLYLMPPGTPYFFWVSTFSIEPVTTAVHFSQIILYLFSCLAYKQGVSIWRDSCCGNYGQWYFHLELTQGNGPAKSWKGFAVGKKAQGKITMKGCEQRTWGREGCAGWRGVHREVIIFLPLFPLSLLTKVVRTRGASFLLCPLEKPKWSWRELEVVTAGHPGTFGLFSHITTTAASYITFSGLLLFSPPYVATGLFRMPVPDSLLMARPSFFRTTPPTTIHLHPHSDHII